MNNEENYDASVDLGVERINDILSTPIDEIYIKHHGVEGMKWGEQNGPPYPLEGAGKKAFLEQRKAVRLEKKKKKILKDPKKVIKNSHLFTKEELDAANEKFESLRKTKEHAKEGKLTKRQLRMAKDPMTLEKNMHKFSPEDLDLAIAQLDRQNKLWDKKLDEIRKPQKTMKVVDDYLGTFSSILRNVSGGISSVGNIYDSTAKFTGKKLTLDDRYEVYKKKHSPDKDIFNKKVTDAQLKEKFADMSEDDINEYIKKLMSKGGK